ncbi:unnamed protein product [Pleuronectes platessa]|uniref:G-protein coupled receptors family 2 profile 1 domain-containing protein n=1 Tax=Pleuronectes platessa TaxID=8262 RepID=A0A9N7VVA7_PLEPL|nr:unnamed protein product [Pleuronectes platessa]
MEFKMEISCPTVWDDIRCWSRAAVGQVVSVSCANVSQLFANNQGGGGHADDLITRWPPPPPLLLLLHRRRRAAAAIRGLSPPSKSKPLTHRRRGIGPPGSERCLTPRLMRLDTEESAHNSNPHTLLG